MSNTNNDDPLEGPSTAAPGAAITAASTARPAATDTRSGETKKEAYAREIEEGNLEWNRIIAAADRTINQAEYCTGDRVELPEITKILANEAGWDEFAREVEILLTPRYNLLIDEKRLRPRPDDPKAKDWHRESNAIKAWLILSISRSLYLNVEMLLGKEPEFADDMWRGIKLATRNYGIHREIKVLKRYENLNRERFKTLHAYIIAHSQKLKDMEEAGFHPDMKAVILSMLTKAAHFGDATVKNIMIRLHELDRKSSLVYSRNMYREITREIIFPGNPWKITTFSRQ